MSKSFTIIHGLIIAIFFLGLQGCGYKADPFYTQNTLENNENNESQRCEKEK